MNEPRYTGIPCSYTEPKARKEYKCHWCSEIILKHEKHYHLKGHWQGDWQDWRMHTLCYDRNSDEISDGFEPFENERVPQPPPHAEKEPS